MKKMQTQGPTTHNALANAGTTNFRQPIDKHVFGNNPRPEHKAPEVTKKEEAPKTIGQKIYQLLLDTVPLPGSVVTAIGHLLACYQDIFHYDKESQKKADNYSLNTSKWLLSGNCVLQFIEALKANRVVEAISRIIEPVFIIAERKVEDLGLARGMGLGLSQFVLSQEGIFKELAKRSGITKENMTKGKDLDLNLEGFKKIFLEILEGGIGKNRRFLTGFTLDNIKTQLNKFKENFNPKALGDLINPQHGTLRDRFVAFIKNSGLGHIQTLFAGDTTKDKGHTTAVSGYLMVFGALLGYMDKASRGLCYKLGGTIRNIGGTIADIGLFSHPDPDENISAIFLTIATNMDIFQRFIPSSMHKLIKAWGNFSMAAYNIGCAFYLNRSNMRTNKEEETKEYDTDLKTATQLAQPVSQNYQYAQVA